MLFKLTNASVICQVLINNVIQAYLDQTAIIYLNNILIYSETKEEYVQHIQEVIACLAEFNLILNANKCKFYKKQVIFLEFVMIITGIEINLNKIKSIKT